MQGAGVRCVPHRPALPRGRDQRRLPVPARSRGRGHRRGGRSRRDERRAGRLRDPQLARGVRRVPVVPAGQALVLLQHPQRDAEDDVGGRDASCRPRSASARSRRRRSSPRARRRRSTRRRRRLRRPARLRRDGRARRRRCSPATCGRGDCGRGVRLRRRRRRGDRRRAPRGRGEDHRGRPRRPQARVGQGSSARRTPSTRRKGDPVEAIQALTDGNGADVVHRSGGQPRGDEAGVLRPRPRRDAGAGRRARPEHDDRDADDRLLRSRRRAEAELVRRLPAEPGLPAAHRPLPARVVCRSTTSCPRRSRSTRSRRRSTKMERGEVLRSVVVL